jgi:hypothetical protein
MTVHQLKAFLDHLPGEAEVKLISDGCTYRADTAAITIGKNVPDTAFYVQTMNEPQKSELRNGYIVIS